MTWRKTMKASLLALLLALGMANPVAAKHVPDDEGGCEALLSGVGTLICEGVDECMEEAVSLARPEDVGEKMCDGSQTDCDSQLAHHCRGPYPSPGCGGTDEA